jgi:hypothetical protein
MDEKNLKQKVIRMIKNSDEIDTFQISIVLMEPIEKVNSIVDDLRFEGLVVES